MTTVVVDYCHHHPRNNNQPQKVEDCRNYQSLCCCRQQRCDSSSSTSSSLLLSSSSSSMAVIEITNVQQQQKQQNVLQEDQKQPDPPITATSSNKHHQQQFSYPPSNVHRRPPPANLLNCCCQISSTLSSSTSSLRTCRDCHPESKIKTSSIGNNKVNTNTQSLTSSSTTLSNADKQMTKMLSKSPEEGHERKKRLTSDRHRLYQCCSSSQCYLASSAPQGPLLQKSQQLPPIFAKSKNKQTFSPLVRSSINLNRFFPSPYPPPPLFQYNQSGTAPKQFSFYMFFRYVKKLFRIFYFCRSRRRRKQRRQRSRKFYFCPPPPPLSEPFSTPSGFPGAAKTNANFFYSNLMCNMNRRSKRRLEQFFEQHRTIMMTLARRKFGVSKMFSEQKKRMAFTMDTTTDNNGGGRLPATHSWMMKPRYRILNSLYNTIVLANTANNCNNRMNGYRYTMIRSVSPSVEGTSQACQRCCVQKSDRWQCCSWFSCCKGDSESSSSSPNRRSRQKSSLTPSSKCIDYLISGLMRSRSPQRVGESDGENSDLIASETRSRRQNNNRQRTPSITSCIDGICCEDDNNGGDCLGQQFCLNDLQRRERKMMERKRIVDCSHSGYDRKNRHYRKSSSTKKFVQDSCFNIHSQCPSYYCCYDFNCELYRNNRNHKVIKSCYRTPPCHRQQRSIDIDENLWMIRKRIDRKLYSSKCFSKCKSSSQCKDFSTKTAYPHCQNQPIYQCFCHKCARKNNIRVENL